MLIGRSWRGALHRWARDRRGVSAIKFAIGAPAFILLLLVGVDTARYVIATRRVEATAATIAQMVSVSTTGQMAPADLQFYEDSTMVIFPAVLLDSYSRGIPWQNDIGLTVSSVTFTGVSPVFIAMTKWSAGSTLRPCLVPLLAAADTALPSPTTLPTDTFGPGTLIVVDVKFTFRPLIAPSFMAPLSIVRSVYVQPRYVSAISFTGAASGKVNQC